MKLPDSVYRKLTVINFCLLGFLVVLVPLTGFILIKDRPIPRAFISEQLKALPKMELFKSRTVERIERLRTEGNIYTPPQYDVKIKPEHLRNIQLLVEQALQKDVLTDEEKVWFPAKFYASGQEYKAKIKLRGHGAAHWSRPKKSWRVKFNKEKLLDGYRVLNFIIPLDKMYENEIVAYDLARELGVLAPDAGFALWRLNGVDAGLYFWHEHNSAQMLERLERPQGEIFREDDLAFHGYGVAADSRAVSLFEGGFATSVHDDFGGGYYVDRWNYLLSLIRHASDEQFAQEIPYLVDMDKFIKWNALTWLFGWHSHHGENLRWYYDSTTGLFEPIVYDVLRMRIERDQSGTFEAQEKVPLIKRILQIDEYRIQRNQVLWKLLNDPHYDPIDRSEKIFKEIRPHLFKGIDPHPADIDRDHKEGMEALRHNKKLIRDLLAYHKILIAPTLLFKDDQPVLSVAVASDALAPLDIKSLTLEFDGVLDQKTKDVRFSLADESGFIKEIVPSEIKVADTKIRIDFEDFKLITKVDKDLKPAPEQLTLRVELSGISSSKWKTPGFLKKVHWEVVNDITQEPLSRFDIFQAPLAYGFGRDSFTKLFVPVNEFIKDSGLPFRLNDKELVLEAGQYLVKGDLIIPSAYSLHLKEGVQLQLAPGVSIVTYQPLTVSGIKSNPVVIRPETDKPWGVLAVIDAKEQSRIKHLMIGGGSEDNINGLYVSGQLSFYSSDVVLENCVITGAAADDGLNIKKANFEINHSRFEKNSSDAFDGDWVKGLIKDSLFTENGGDAVDFSGSDVVIEGNLFDRAGDKAISVGEKSRVVGMNNIIRDSTIGVASKDLSRTFMYSTLFYNNKTAVSVYRKKQVFGGGRAEVVSSVFWNNENNFELDRESSLKLTGVALAQNPDNQQIIAEDIRVGDISSAYKLRGKDEVVFTGQKSVFEYGPQYEPEANYPIALPEFSQHPVGFVGKLNLN